jgi:hypothetical protein
MRDADISAGHLFWHCFVYPVLEGHGVLLCDEMVEHCVERQHCQFSYITGLVIVVVVVVVVV